MGASARTALRVFVAGFATETNTFSPIFADMDSFRASLYAPPGKHPATPTTCTAPLVIARQRSRAEGWTLIEGTTASSPPSGLVQRATYDELCTTILNELKVAIPVDAVLLCLHGAMVAVGVEDPEGDFIAAVRDVVRGRADEEQSRLIALRPLDAWGDVWHALTRLQDETERFALDKRQAIVASLGMLSGKMS